MNLDQTDITALLRSNHPAKPYLIVAGVCFLTGIVRGRLTGLGLLALGGAIAYRGVQELNRSKRLHGGNFHGDNRPPKNTPEQQIVML